MGDETGAARTAEHPNGYSILSCFTSHVCCVVADTLSPRRGVRKGHGTMPRARRSGATPGPVGIRRPVEMRKERQRNTMYCAA